MVEGDDLEFLGGSCEGRKEGEEESRWEKRKRAHRVWSCFSLGREGGVGRLIDNESVRYDSL